MSNDAFSSRSGGTDARPTFEYIRSNSADRRSSASSATALMVRRGWSFGTRSSRSTNASIVTCGSCVSLSSNDHLHYGVVVSYLTISFFRSLLVRNVAIARTMPPDALWVGHARLRMVPFSMVLLVSGKMARTGTRCSPRTDRADHLSLGGLPCRTEDRRPEDGHRPDLCMRPHASRPTRSHHCSSDSGAHGDHSSSRSKSDSLGSVRGAGGLCDNVDTPVPVHRAAAAPRILEVTPSQTEMAAQGP